MTDSQQQREFSSCSLGSFDYRAWTTQVDRWRAVRIVLVLVASLSRVSRRRRLTVVNLNESESMGTWNTTRAACAPLSFSRWFGFYFTLFGWSCLSRLFDIALAYYFSSLIYCCVSKNRKGEKKTAVLCVDVSVALTTIDLQSRAIATSTAALVFMWFDGVRDGREQKRSMITLILSCNRSKRYFHAARVFHLFAVA